MRTISLEEVFNANFVNRHPTWHPTHKWQFAEKFNISERVWKCCAFQRPARLAAARGNTQLFHTISETYGIDCTLILKSNAASERSQENNGPNSDNACKISRAGESGRGRTWERKMNGSSGSSTERGLPRLSIPLQRRSPVQI